MIPEQIYDIDGNLLDFFDATKGKLESKVEVIEHPAKEFVQEQWHWETIAEYPNGGKDVKKVVDVPGQEAEEAWTEEIPYFLYVPFTEEELKEIEEKLKQQEQEYVSIEVLQQKVDELNSLLDALKEGLNS